MSEFFAPSYKRCPDCGEEKPASAYSKNAARPDGLQFYCKECYSIRSARTYRARQQRKGKRVRERVIVPAGMKRCPRCEEIKPRSEFHRATRQYDGRSPYCKTCRSQQSRADHLRRAFGLTEEQRLEIVARQQMKCAICGSADISHTDHDHATGRVRGLLCAPCNMGLGQFRDDPVRLMAAVRYLRAAPFEVEADSELEISLADYLRRHRSA